MLEVNIMTRQLSWTFKPSISDFFLFAFKCIHRVFLREITVSFLCCRVWKAWSQSLKYKRSLKTTDSVFYTFPYFVYTVFHLVTLISQCSALPDSHSTDLLYDCIQSVCDIIESRCLLEATVSRVRINSFSNECMEI